MAEYVALQDNSQAGVVKGTGITRIIQVDANGAVLGSGTDFFGGAFGSIYQLPFRKTSKWLHTSAVSRVNDDTGSQIASISGNDEASLEFEVIGNFEKKVGSIFYSAERLALSGKRGIYWKLANYVQIEVPDGSGTLYVYKKRILWMCRTEAMFQEDTKSDGTPRLWTLKFIPESLPSASVDADLGQLGTFKKVNAIQALGATETFEAQTEVS